MKKNAAVDIADRPVRPPSATPEEASTKVVTVEVPMTEPQQVAIASDSMARLTLGISPSSSYELMHEKGFPVLRVGNRLVVPKEKFRQWVEEQITG